MYELDIEALAARLGAGQHTGLPCPACSGATSDRALSMHIDGYSIKAVCHRASCGFKFRNAYASVVDGVRPSRARPYTGELRVLDATDKAWLSMRFQLSMHMLQAIRKSDGRYFLPIVAPDGNRRGWVSRRPWEGSPLWDSADASCKSLTYMDDESPVMSWYRGPNSTTVLVEDQISAMRVVQDTRLSCVALLGTGVNEEKVSEIQRHAKHILIALDSDATGQAFNIARKWGQAFESCRVVILEYDIKDTPCAMVETIFS